MNTRGVNGYPHARTTLFEVPSIDSSIGLSSFARFERRALRIKIPPTVNKANTANVNPVNSISIKILYLIGLRMKSNDSSLNFANRTSTDECFYITN